MTWNDGSVSTATAAVRLGVPCSAVWHLIVEGRLQAYADRRGSRVYTRVLLPDDTAACLTEPPEGAPLTTQVERLTATVERLTSALHNSRCRAVDDAVIDDVAPVPGHRRKQRRAATPADPAESSNEIPPLDTFLKPAGLPQALRPNPMTHPVEVLSYARPDSRAELLAPVRQLFEQHQRQWWQRLPLVSRG